MSERLIIPDMETELLKGCLSDPNNPDIALLCKLDAADWSPGNREAFRIIKRTWTNHGDLDPASVSTEIFSGGNGSEQLAKLNDWILECNGVPFGVSKLLEKLLDAKRVQKAFIAVGGMLGSTDIHSADPRAVSAQLRGIADAMDGESITDPVDTLDAYWDRVSCGEPIVPRDRHENLIRWGLPRLDDAIRSHPGSLGVIAAKTSAGKSSLAMQAALQTANRGTHTLVLGLEMTRDELATRMMGQWLGCDSWKLANGQAPVCDRPVWMDTLHVHDRIPHGGFEEACSLIRRQSRKGVRVVFVDYWTLVRPVITLKSTSVAFMLGEMSRGFKQLAKDTDTHIVLVSQFNREVKEAQRPTLENLRETGQLEQDASWVLMMWAEKEKYAPDERRTIFMELQKNRSGRRWVECCALFDAAVGNFAEVERTTEAPKKNMYE